MTNDLREIAKHIRDNVNNPEVFLLDLPPRLENIANELDELVGFALNEYNNLCTKYSKTN